ncbi:MAG: hypothetical protein ACK5S2_03245 [Lysobacteraceae bacterium]|jgi:hypothetical protein|nr:hypothetical protein [Xanthomonadaceae bacterium]MCZ8317296.1 hypothetical protein [Silanimonas sp.]
MNTVPTSPSLAAPSTGPAMRVNAFATHFNAGRPEALLGLHAPNDVLRRDASGEWHRLIDHPFGSQAPA